ncbi:MAG: PP2C family protein-serine/threonine phosphatase [Porticoccaceae bacterium]|nr:PP2C family protein-serine/threonine phosphatase [Porticoccaceae bacterium]
MSKLEGPVILVGDDAVGLKPLAADFHAVGSKTLTAEDAGALDSACHDPLNQPVVLLAANNPIDSAEQRANLRQLCEDYLVVVALDDTHGDQVADFFRLGVADVLTANSSAQALEQTLERVGNLAETRQRVSAYSAELEKTNVELQESLRLLKQDQLAGLEVQKSLMPESPLAFGDYEISHSITPSLYLSGDFVGYNFVLDRYLLFYFADVSGHGASSAFVTVLLRFMIGRVIRRHMLEHDYVALAQAPEGLVEYINNQLLATGLGKHLTIVAGSLDTETRQLRYVVGAQQPQPILISGGKAKFLPGKGKPAGIFEDASWVVEQIHLPERFALVLLSDGVYDLLPNKEIENKERTLLRYLSTSSGNIDQLKEALFIDYIEDPQDDISVLLLTGGM